MIAVSAHWAAHALAAGEFAAVSGDVAWLTGREPMTLAEFLHGDRS